ncbi:MAG: GNAT family N-acetyltransferase [Eggerthellaceae bacterium]|nr:GNAT family N-acetyltransferase [Eggerthellaceae bacterium]
MDIVKATPEQFPQVRAFYFAVIDGLADAEYGPGWEKDIYPAPEYLADAIGAGELYIGVDEGSREIIAAMVLNHHCNEAYQGFPWPTEAAPDEVMVIHTLAVLPQHTGKGYAKQLVRFAIDVARTQRQKAIRLDVLAGNVPAERLYTALGFVYLGTIPMFYEDTGWTDYELYELRLPETQEPSTAPAVPEGRGA